MKRFALLLSLCACGPAFTTVDPVASDGGVVLEFTGKDDGGTVEASQDDGPVEAGDLVDAGTVDAETADSHTVDAEAPDTFKLDLCGCTTENFGKACADNWCSYYYSGRGYTCRPITVAGQTTDNCGAEDGGL